MASKKLKSESPISSNFIDGASIRSFCIKLSESVENKNKNKIIVNFGELISVLWKIRTEAGWTNTTQSTNSSLLFATVDPDNKSQQSFLNAIQKIGITAETSRISYAMGLQARHNSIELIVLTHDFALCSALLDLASRSSSFKVGLAYFGCLLEDRRWHNSPVLAAASPVKLFNLDVYASKILGVN